MEIQGTAWVTETFIAVQFLWLIVPLAAVVFVLILMLAVMIHSKRHNIPAWKNSQWQAMAMLEPRPRQAIKYGTATPATTRVALMKGDDKVWGLYDENRTAGDKLSQVHTTPTMTPEEVQTDTTGVPSQHAEDVDSRQHNPTVSKQIPSSRPENHEYTPAMIARNLALARTSKVLIPRNCHDCTGSENSS